MARLESDISWMWKNKTGFSGRMLQEVINLKWRWRVKISTVLMMISRARSAWRGGQGVWLPGPATHSETRGNHRWGRSELWIIFATSSKVSKLEDGCRSHRQTSNVTGPRGSQGVEVRFEFSWQHKTPPTILNTSQRHRSNQPNPSSTGRMINTSNEMLEKRFFKLSSLLLAAPAWCK